MIEKRSVKILKLCAELSLLCFRIVFSLLMLIFALTAVFWKAPSLVVWFCLIVFTAAIATRKPGKRRIVFRIAGAGLAVYTAAFSAFLWRVPFDELQSRMRVIHNKAYNMGAQSYTTFDCLAVYSGNIVMGVVGYPIFPEVAWETLRMALPGPSRHIIESDFAMRSRKVRSALSPFLRKLPKKGDGTRKMKTKAVSWTGGDYSALSYNEARVALALNCPFILKAKATRDKDRWKIDCEGSCDVSYGRFEKMEPFFSVWGEKFYISETMFNPMQKLGWMFPYDVIYKWSFYSDDKRMRDG